MPNVREQDHIIEATRLRLNDLVEAKKFNMKDPEVIRLSDELDRLIVEYEKFKKIGLR